jgi:hypothetical protein
VEPNLDEFQPSKTDHLNENNSEEVIFVQSKRDAKQAAKKEQRIKHRGSRNSN